MASMDGTVALVTGAASGIGQATAIGLARDGATVVLLVRNAARGEQALRDVRASRAGRDARDAGVRPLVAGVDPRGGPAVHARSTTGSTSW